MAKFIFDGLFFALFLGICLLCSPLLQAEDRASIREDWSSLRLSDKEIATEKAHFLAAFGSTTIDRLLESQSHGVSLRGPSKMELAALDFFRKEAGYFEVNAYLRGAKSANYPQRGLLALARLVASALNKLPEDRLVKGEVYRGTHLHPKVIASRYGQGQTVLEPSFTSCCADRSIAAIYARGAKQVGKQEVLFVIKSETGKRVSDGLTGEILFLPMTSFKVTRLETDEWKRFQIFLDEVVTNK